MKRAFPILAAVTAVLLAYALYQALLVAPTDAQQGDVYRIIYYHVPSAWTAFLHQLHRLGAVSRGWPALDPASCEMDCGCRRRRRRSGGVRDSLAGGHPAERDCDHGVGDTRFLFVPGEIFSRRKTRCAGRDHRRSRSRILHHRSDYGADLGAAGVGYLVGAGRHPADFHAGAVVDLRELPDPSAFL